MKASLSPPLGIRELRASTVLDYWFLFTEVLYHKLHRKRGSAMLDFIIRYRAFLYLTVQKTPNLLWSNKHRKGKSIYEDFVVFYMDNEPMAWIYVNDGELWIFVSEDRRRRSIATIILANYLDGLPSSKRKLLYNGQSNKPIEKLRKQFNIPKTRPRPIKTQPHGD